MTQEFARLMGLPLEDGRLLILTHHNPDPDTVASAAALRYLFERTRGIEPTVAYSGVIGRAENRAMVDLLDLPMRRLAEIDLDDYPYVALIDAQPRTGNNALPDDRVATIVIDHHPLRDATRASPFYDVREDLGASATILTEYLRQADLEIPTDLATALLYGIRSETQDLGREASDADMEAYRVLFPLADPLKLAAISLPPLAPTYYAQLARALDALTVGETVTICAFHDDDVTDPDFIPEMADFAARMRGISWSLVHGSFEGTLYLSIRANDPDANAGSVMQRVLAGFGKGGGHGMRAGGNVDIASVSMDRLALERELQQRFLAAIGAAGERFRRLKGERPAGIAATITPKP
ncbi:MAG TPA: DHH family phosphoesterase [Thermoanaerobaculia bacterium]